MKLSHALFTAFTSGYMAVLVITFWINKFGGDISCLGQVITGLVATAAICLFLMYAPASILTPAAIAFGGITVITLIVFWIFGN